MEHDPKLAAVMRKIEALLQTKGCSESEAQARVAKAQELLERHNLDMATIGRPSNARNDKKRAGGLYSWQRKLWAAVAQLNFCHHLCLKGLEKGAKYEHRLIGSHGNVVATEMMAQYLQETIEKLAQKWAYDEGYHSVFVREAIAYREGMTERLSYKLDQRRQEVVAEARKRQQEEQAKARTDAAPGTTALTILDVISTEEDFNWDYLNGLELGTTARNKAKSKAEHEAYMAAWREKKRKQDEWDAAHPEEARKRKLAEEEALRKQTEKWAKEDAKRQARANRTPPRQRRKTAEEERRDMGSYWRGYNDGANVGIDRQASNERRERIA